MKPGRIHRGGWGEGEDSTGGNLTSWEFTRGKDIGIGIAYLHVFLIAVHGIDTAAGVHVEPFQTNMLEFFCENS